MLISSCNKLIKNVRQGKGGGDHSGIGGMRRMREFAPIMSSPENPEGMPNLKFLQDTGK